MGDDGGGNKDGGRTELSRTAGRASQRPRAVGSVSRVRSHIELDAVNCTVDAPRAFPTPYLSVNPDGYIRPCVGNSKEASGLRPQAL